MWPRHTGDFGFYRAYVGKDGNPADYSKDNVPYKPKHHLKINAKGVQDGDYIMVIGYPGRTNRYRTAKEVAFTFTKSYPLTKELMGSIVKTIESVTEPDSDARIKYQSLIAGLNNYEKNRGSMIESYHKGTTQQRKDALDKALRKWVNSNHKRKAKYGKAIQELDALVEKAQQHYQRDAILGYSGIASMLSSASRLYRLALEKQKPDMEREAGYQERDWDRIKQSLQRINRRFDANVEKAILMNLMTRYAKLPQSERIAAIDKFFGIGKQFDAKKLKQKLDSMYAETKLSDEKTRLAWMDKSPEDFKKSKDPFIQYAVQTYDARKKLEEESKELSGQLAAVRPKYMEAIIAYNKARGLPIYADANSTLRITYGNVKGYMPKDGLFAVPFTTLRGLLEKETGEEPFNSPSAVLQAIKEKRYGKYYDKKLDSVPVNYLGTLDITGGNSGSPTLNDKAEFVGLVFDGVYESIIGDWDYDPELNRSITVDSRYMLWIMEEIDGADNLIKEMDIVR
jgi:hypothetical protein